MQKKNQLFEDLKLLKKEINDLRNELNSVDGQKEEWFKKKEEHGAKIREFIRNIKENKKKRDELTKKVKEDKKKRDELNKEIKDKISKIKELKKEKEAIAGKYNIQENPSRIKEIIEKLDLSIETEVMSFENEKKVMKKIKGLKKKFGEAKIIMEAEDSLRKASKDVDEFKRKSNDIHTGIQNRAKESQKLHENLITDSKSIDSMKEEEEKAFEKFVEFKKKFTRVNDLLKEKLTKMNDMGGKLDNFKLKKDEERKLKDDFFIKNKEAEVEQKMRRGEKLTTEDLLIFQQNNSKI
ncbi:hypothetical protein ISS05_01700 [Candidatus Woesearchaeota archaeon]|nr:hypothetical protein [Candidatus Woesearchaeota archaeon]